MPLDNNSEDVIRSFFEKLERFNTSSSFNSAGNAESLGTAFDNLETSTSKLRGAQQELSTGMRLSKKVLTDTFFGHIIGSSGELGKLEKSLQSSASGVDQLGKEVKAAEEAVQKLGAANTAEGKAQLAAARRRLESARSEHDAAQESHNLLASRFGKIGATVEGVTKVMSQGASLIGKAVDGFMSVTDNLLKGENAIGFATSTLQTSVSLVAESLKLVGTVANSMGAVLEHTPAKFAANVAKLAGYLANATAEQAERVNKGLQILSDELQKTVNSYHTLTSVGANFAGGMEEMRKLSQSAAMGLSEFTKIVQSNADAFATAGLGMTNAAKRFASISKSMSETGLREQISNLGYSFEEFGGLTADVMAQLNETGQLRFKSDQEIGQLTVEYAKNLRLISDITGQDAKKRMEAARKESLKAGIYEKLMAMGGPEAVNKFKAQMTAMPDSMQQGYMEFIASGGTAIRDVATNIAMQQMPAMMDVYREGFNTLGNASIDSTTAGQRVLEGAGRVGEQARQPTALGQTLGFASIFGAGGAAADSANLATKLRAETMKYGKDVAEARATIDKTATDPGKLTKTVSETTEQFQRAKSEVEGLADKALPGFASMLGAVTTSVKDFGEALGEVTKALGGEVTEEKKPEGPGVFSRMKSWFTGSDEGKQQQPVEGGNTVAPRPAYNPRSNAATSAWDKNYGATHNADGTLKTGTSVRNEQPPKEANTATKKETVKETKTEIRIAGEPVIPGQLLSSRQIEVMKMSMNSGNSYPPDIMDQFTRQTSNAAGTGVGIDPTGKPKKALGGITSGVSIAGERGPEAVVPLPNGRSIPVDIQSTNINYGGINKSGTDPVAQVMNSLEEFFKNQLRTMQKDSDTMDSMLRVLQDSYSTQDKLLANSY